MKGRKKREDRRRKRGICNVLTRRLFGPPEPPAPEYGLRILD
jgi:hypothetical protein